MRNLLRCCRGSASFATVVALVPLIGAVALGAEGGSWYVTRQHAQNAADAAAYSGALRLACSLAAGGGVACADANSVDYRGKQFAAQNAFCNAGDTSYPGSRCLTSLPSGTSQAVQIAVNGNFVRADFVAKRFCPSDRARLIQDLAPLHNLDSNTLRRRFDCCQFLFHRTFAATFATISASCRLMQRSKTTSATLSPCRRWRARRLIHQGPSSWPSRG